ncbi:MAG TPA: hypothetical protein PKA17_10810, partial [Phenylobacterium sp.]|nr:hypothetical protein [Phenylobacterium sp.]
MTASALWVRSPSMCRRQPAGLVGDAHDAPALLGHDQQGFGHGGVARDEGQFALAVHQVPHRAQHGAQLSAGMEGLEVAGGEAPPFQQGDGQGVADGDLQGGGGGGRIDRGGGLTGVGQLQHDVSRRPKRAVGHGGEGDERDGQARGGGPYAGQLPRFA